MKIIIIAVQPFPIGMAATNRLLSYSRGLAELNNIIEIHIIRSTEKKNNLINDKISGIYNNIIFRYTSGTTLWPNSKIGKLWNYIKGVTNSIRLILNNKSPNYIFSLSTSYLVNLFYFLICKVRKIKLIRVEDEYPVMLINSTKKYSKIYTFIYLKTYFKMFDGMIVMTDRLKKYYQQKVSSRSRILVSPMTVEPDRFVGCNVIDEKSPYIAYCGYIGGNKDGVDILIKAFSLFYNYRKDFKLYIIGFTNNSEEMKKIKDLVQKLKLVNQIVFTGKIDRNQIPGYLCSAKILALARPSSKQAEGGFPTKLGEYLATGNPVVCTKVGDIPKYISDGKDAYVCKPDSPEDFAKKLITIADNYKEALKVGKNGQKLVFDIFNYKVQAKKINSFLKRA